MYIKRVFMTAWPVLGATFVAALASSAQLPDQTQDRYSGSSRTIVFDAPNAGTTSVPACAPFCGTQPLANNDWGAIVGTYTDANVVPHGFLRTPSGNFVSFDAPGAGLGANLDEGTVAVAINDLGVIAGQFEDANITFHGFIRYPDGSFVSIDAPGAGAVPGQGQGTLAYSLNLEGTTAGIYIDASGVTHGFVRSPFGKITGFDPPGSIYTFVCEETCLNAAGEITGSYYDASGVEHGFLRESDGSITTFDPPASLGAGGASINEEGTITGYYADTDGMYRGFVRSRDGAISTFALTDPATGAAQNTAVFSINLFGAVTGVYVDAGVFHGFSRSADGKIARFDAPGACTNCTQGTRPSTNNAEGQVVGWTADANNLLHGFLWIP
ncbi:MAG: hypothetical protein ACLPWG_24005 [Steroidobacteraceae bacterium]